MSLFYAISYHRSNTLRGSNPATDQKTKLRQAFRRLRPGILTFETIGTNGTSGTVGTVFVIKTFGTFETSGTERSGGTSETGRSISVPNVLQKPFGRNLTPEAGLLGELIDFARHRVELGALQITALGISDLIRRAATFHLAGDETGERDAPIRQRVAVLAAVAAAVSIFMLLWACLIADMLGVGG